MASTTEQNEALTGHGVHVPPKHAAKIKAPGSQSHLLHDSVSVKDSHPANPWEGKHPEVARGWGEGMGRDRVRVQASFWGDGNVLDRGRGDGGTAC